MSSRGSHRSCSTDTAIYEDRNHVMWNNPPVVLRPMVCLGSLGQFCGAFYHVPARNSGAHYCLDESQCKIGRRIVNNGQGAYPRTVVAIIKCEDKDGRVTYEARYTNCYNDKMHAEDYFRLDVERGALRTVINDNKVNMITMYITFQPCHMTVKGTFGAREEHSCCDTLLTLFRDHQFSTRLNNIEICIKPTHIYKADMKWTPVDYELNEAIRNAVEGIKILMRADIEVSRMDETDWEYLLGMVTDKRIPAYRGSPRETLDIEIGMVTNYLKIDIAVEQPFSHKCDTSFGIYDDCRHTLLRQEVPDCNFLGNESQICAAFYHIYEEQRAVSSDRFLCFDSRSCFTSRKRRKLKGLFELPKTTVAVVKCQVNGVTVYEARYTDCYGFAVSAEEFFIRDATVGALGVLINRGIAMKITMYITWPPRHKSASDTRNQRDYSSCEALEGLYVSRLKPRNVQFSVKLAHVYKEGWLQHEDSIRAGIKILVGSGIIVAKMEEIDWNYLLSIARLPLANYTTPGAWDWGSRKILDEAIGEFLSQINQEIQCQRKICSLLLKMSLKSNC